MPEISSYTRLNSQLEISNEQEKEFEISDKNESTSV